jgi:choline-sulfatase
VPQLVPPPNRIVSIREARYKLARYYDGDGIEPDQWEMYDLETDPHERVNLTFQSTVRERLTAKLREVEATRLQPLPG